MALGAFLGPEASAATDLDRLRSERYRGGDWESPVVRPTRFSAVEADSEVDAAHVHLDVAFRDFLRESSEDASIDAELARTAGDVDGRGGPRRRAELVATLPAAAPFAADDACPICLIGAAAGDDGSDSTPADGDDDTPVALACGHRYHRGCVAEWLRDQATCPQCRVRVLRRVFRRL